jgi:SpoVK/Ycf46/Vps4 family AAA+-type ATPase
VSPIRILLVEREAGSDLWRIDLSSVVSKYIGETEKHLDRIFTLARDGNAILFFDEADALFGKRSEDKDAQDRYANIEVAFLLQRLEAFEGVVILASNLARNVDPAFSRRMHFVIEFPLPDAALRARLWRAALPAVAPLADEVDLAFLARQFALAGGDIRVAALDAAFAAACDDAPIDMARLCQAVSRQLLKQGKVPAASDLRQYQGRLTAADARMAAG